MNDFNFISSDKGTTIDWDTGVNNNINDIISINNILGDNVSRIVGLTNNEIDVSGFGYQIGYLNRNNFSYLRTETYLLFIFRNK